jgi:hypothetical protein
VLEQRHKPPIKMLNSRDGLLLLYSQEWSNMQCNVIQCDILGYRRGITNHILDRFHLYTIIMMGYHLDSYMDGHIDGCPH